MHHSHDPIDEEMLARFGLGPTGKFPEGKLCRSDEGEIRFRIGAADGKVVLDFRKPVTWIGCDPHQAREVARSLVDMARAAEDQKTKLFAEANGLASQ